MQENVQEPLILAQYRTKDGIAFQVRRDRRGILEVPGFESILISLHIGSPSSLTCRRGGDRFVGTAMHGDIDIIPAYTPS
jgi:AraC family transcriptional regulator